jgi:hypothetical protein
MVNVECSMLNGGGGVGSGLVFPFNIEHSTFTIQHCLSVGVPAVSFTMTAHG